MVVNNTVRPVLSQQCLSACSRAVSLSLHCATVWMGWAHECLHIVGLTKGEREGLWQIQEMVETHPVARKISKTPRG